jgi:hypothetical protein
MPYARPPITEAVIEFRFSVTFPKETIESAGRRLRSDYPLLDQENMVQIKVVSSAAGWSSSSPARPSSHGSRSSCLRSTGIRSCTSATNLFGSVMIMVQDFSVSPLVLSRHSSHRPAIVSADEPLRAVKYQGCLPLGVSWSSREPSLPTAPPLRTVHEGFRLTRLKPSQMSGVRTRSVGNDAGCVEQGRQPNGDRKGSRHT